MSETTSRIMTLPTLALRGVSVFPGTMLHFDVERPISIAALNAAIGTDRMIFLVAQRSMAVDLPRSRDLYEIGAICRVGQILRTPAGGTVKCIVDGLYRGRLLRLTAQTPCMWANVQVLADHEVDNASVETAALIRSVNEVFGEYASASGAVGPEALLKAADRQDAGFVSDFVTQNVYLRPEDKQSLLEELDPIKRLTMLNELLRREMEIMDIQHDLRSAASEQMARHQREYYLREQMRLIQEELGEDSPMEEMEEYRQKIQDLHLEEDVEKKLLKELSRLGKQAFGSAESSVLRTYLDICLELPWNTRTEDVTDIARAKKILDEDHYGLDNNLHRVCARLGNRGKRVGYYRVDVAVEKGNAAVYLWLGGINNIMRNGLRAGDKAGYALQRKWHGKPEGDQSPQNKAEILRSAADNKTHNKNSKYEPYGGNAHIEKLNEKTGHENTFPL